MSLPQCIEGCPQHETRVRHEQRHRSRTVSKTSLRGEQGTQQIQDLRGGRGVQSCLEGVQGASRGGLWGSRQVQVSGSRAFGRKNRSCMYIQDFVPALGQRGRFNLPSVQHATQGSADMKGDPACSIWKHLRFWRMLCSPRS